MQDRGYTIQLIALTLCIAFTCNGFSGEVRLRVYSGFVDPPHIRIHVGDSVTWENGWDEPESISLASAAGEWETEQIFPGESSSLTFTNAGLYAYGLSHSKFIGRIEVKPLDQKESALALVAPVDGSVLRTPQFSFYSRTFLARVGMPHERIERVEFYSKTNLLGTAREFPYRIQLTSLAEGDYAVHVALVDKDGNVHVSEPVRLSLVSGYYSSRNHFSLAGSLANGDFVFHVIPADWGHNEILYTSDLVNWKLLDVITQEETIVDKSAADSSQRFYWVRQSNPP